MSVAKYFIRYKDIFQSYFKSNYQNYAFVIANEHGKVSYLLEKSVYFLRHGPFDIRGGGGGLGVFFSKKISLL